MSSSSSFNSSTWYSASSHCPRCRRAKALRDGFAPCSMNSTRPGLYGFAGSPVALPAGGDEREAGEQSECSLLHDALPEVLDFLRRLRDDASRAPAASRRLRAGILQAAATEPHPPHHVVALDEMVPQRAGDVHDDERRQQVRGDHVRFFEEVVQRAIADDLRDRQPEQVERHRTFGMCRRAPSR